MATDDIPAWGVHDAPLFLLVLFDKSGVANSPDKIRHTDIHPHKSPQITGLKAGIRSHFLLLPEI
ncbi:MAG: hypothetical protein FWD65_03605 [Coriobacteriia bacterium]|nr:hypothetical protein [Coriobacteriia bacterium]